MSDETFGKAMAVHKDIAEAFGKPVVVGLTGGEPTLHPHLMDYIDFIIKYPQWFYPMVTTNGTNAEVCWKILDLAKAGKINAVLSRDNFHREQGPIDPQLEAEWRAEHDRRNFSREYAELLGVYTGAMIFYEKSVIINEGRARENVIKTVNGCRDPHPFITATGEIYSCGCFIESFGTVDYPSIPDNLLDIFDIMGLRYCARRDTHPARRF